MHNRRGMGAITFFDTEVSIHSKKIGDIGAVKNAGNIFRSGNLKEFSSFLRGTEYLIGHNIIRHDLKYFPAGFFEKTAFVDTLFLSPLLFPTRPYHRLLKDDKLQTEELNNPVNDAKKVRDLFYDEVEAFNRLDDALKAIYYLLLSEQEGFAGFFEYLSYSYDGERGILTLIKDFLGHRFCANARLHDFVTEYPVALAYSIALINTTDRYSITPPWVLLNYPEVENIMYLLRSHPCPTGCAYCDEALDANKGLKDFFGYESFRKFDGEPLQEMAVKAALNNHSMLCIFPTGGGKSLTFQIPALMAGRNVKGLSVVISPLQSLMKDQVDNLEKIGITEAVTINGLLDPIDRAKSIERVKDGSASILYISPESLRSKTIERLLLSRNIVRFIIDEAHCFSAWGQDFRVDYLYIGEFIRHLQQQKNKTKPIPVSCFTATAKQKVVEDICNYFEKHLSLRLEIFQTKVARTNLRYQVFNTSDEQEKYNSTRRLIQSNPCPTIVYVSRTRRAYQLAEDLTKDGFNARPYHGKMDAKEKTENQNAFIAGEVPVIVATSAFGMGVDKKDVGMVIHYDISDSLENYVQEAGRAGRDEHILADCYVLFSEDDLNKHFTLLNQTKLSAREIQQIWRAIKSITKFRSTASNSALEIARQAGWDDSVSEIETRVKTAISALEQAGYLRRGHNVPQIFANGILTKNAQEAIERIKASPLFTPKQEVEAIRIIKKLFSSKSKKHGNDEQAEARVDYISDHLGIVKEEVIKIITLLREEKILADTKDLTAFIRKDDKRNRSLSIVRSYARIENFLLPLFDERERIFNIKELNESAIAAGCEKSTPHHIKKIINFWVIKNFIKRKQDRYKNHLSIVALQDKETLQGRQHRRHELSEFVVNYLFEKTQHATASDKGEELVEFSVHELREAFGKRKELFESEVSIDDIEDTLFYLSRIGAIKIEGGFMVVYNKLTIDRIEKNNQIQYKNDDYKQLEQFYKSKMEQIHIVGEYAKKMLHNYEEALRFVEDYFQLDYTSFLKKYFPGNRKKEIQRNITPKKFKQLFGELSPAQLQIIKDNQSKNILVAAGPGSGKTRVLVHKLASLLLMEDVKHEQLLMLTFSRAAATEFKKRLLGLIGNAAHFVEIKTFHSYCFDLLGRVGSIEKSEQILQDAVRNIKNGSVEVNRITKSVLVIDEAQDMDAYEFELVEVLMKKNPEMRLIAVGDDDQNIYTFRGADSKYFEQFLKGKRKSMKYELVENYRSKRNLVEFTNQFAARIRRRLKSTPIVSVQPDNGRIRVFHYPGGKMIVPLVNDVVATNPSGTTAILTRTNEEAAIITGLLLNRGLPARLIQSNDGFDLYDLLEIRTFLSDLNLDSSSPIIGRNRWNAAKRLFVQKFGESPNFEMCKRLIKDFQETNNKVKYRSDFETFIRESKLEDFLYDGSETIYVSTIHKAKGKEFDNVFLMLNNFNAGTDDAKRQLYVALTRAKQNITIHYNAHYLSNIEVEGLRRTRDLADYPPPQKLRYELTHKDIYLGYFGSIQPRIEKLRSGDSLGVYDEGLLDREGNPVLRFSRKFMEMKSKWAKKHFQLIEAKVNFIVYWKNHEEREVKILLPVVYFYV